MKLRLVSLMVWRFFSWEFCDLIDILHVWFHWSLLHINHGHFSNVWWAPYICLCKIVWTTSTSNIHWFSWTCKTCAIPITQPNLFTVDTCSCSCSISAKRDCSCSFCSSANAWNVDVHKTWGNIGTWSWYSHSNQLIKRSVFYYGAMN